MEKVEKVVSNIKIFRIERDIDGEVLIRISLGEHYHPVTEELTAREAEFLAKAIFPIGPGESGSFNV